MADFDPDAFLKGESPAFDPDAFLKEETPSAAPKEPAKETSAPSAARTFVDSAANALPFGKQVVDAATAGIVNLYRKHLASGGVKLSPEAEKELRAAGAFTEDPAFGEEYRKARDERAALDAAGKVAHPEAAGVGTGAGMALGILAPLPGVKLGSALAPGAKLTASQVLRRLPAAIASGAVNGGIYGGLGGLTGSEAMAEGDIKGALKDALKGGEFGALIGAPLGAAGEVVTSKGADVLRALGIGRGRRALLSGADSLSARAPVSDEAVAEAIESGGLRPFSSAESSAERLRKLSGEAGKAKGEIVRDLRAAGVEGPDPVRHGVEILDAADALQQRTAAGNPQPAMYRRFANDLANKEVLPSGNLDLEQAEAIKSDLQDQAAASYAKMRSKKDLSGLGKEELASRLRKANEDAIAAQAAKAPELAAKFVPAKEKYARLIEAANAASRGAQRELSRSPGGLLGDVAIGEGLANASPQGVASGLILGPAAKVFKERLPSAVATGAYGGAKLLRALGSQAPGTAAEIIRQRLKKEPPRVSRQPAEAFDLGDLGKDE